MTGEMIRRHRRMRGLTQEDLAKKLGTDTGYIARLETGRIKNPGIDTMIKISTALGISVSQLTGDTSNVSPLKTEVVVWTDDELDDDQKRAIETLVKTFKQRRR